MNKMLAFIIIGIFIISISIYGIFGKHKTSEKDTLWEILFPNLSEKTKEGIRIIFFVILIIFTLYLEILVLFFYI